MRYVNNDGVRIYYEVEGEGPPLVLMYGICHKLRVWRMLDDAEPLKRDYQLVLIDTRGHGLSVKPHDPELYSRPLLAADVVAVLDDLNIERAHYLGYSMGGFIGYGVAQHASERFYSLLLGGAALPWERDPDLPRKTIDQFQFTGGVDVYIAAVEAIVGEPLTPEWDAYMRDNDLDALAGMLSAEDGILSYGFRDVAQYLTLPYLYFVGESEEDVNVRQYVERVPDATYAAFPGLDHLSTWASSDLVVPLVRRFLAGACED